MMAFSSSGEFPIAVDAREEELFIAEVCKKARMENTALGKRRKELRSKLNVLRDKLQQNEDDYWRQYHLRLSGTDKAAPAKQWIGSFATKESAVVRLARDRMDELRRQLRGLEGQYQEVDDEFWAKWQAYMTRLANTPRPSPAPFSDLSPVSPDSPWPSDLTPPVITTQPSKLSHKDDDTMAPPPLPRRISHLGLPARPKYGRGSRFTANTRKDTHFGQDGPHHSNSLPMPTGQTVQSPIVPVKASSAALSKPARTYASPLASSVLFPHRPTSAKLVTDSHGTSLPDKTGSGNMTATRGASIPTINTHVSSHAHNATTLEDERSSSRGVTSPQVGHIYKAYYKHDNDEGWWMCTVLPTLPAHESEAWEREVGISFTTANIDLWCDAPMCYNLTTESKRKAGKSIKRHHVITGWHQGYGDGQPLENERAFPVLFFEDVRGAQGHFNVPMPPKKFTFKPQAWDWVEAKNLRPVDADVGPVHGEKTADKFVKRLEALKQKDDTSESSAPTSPVDQPGPAAKRRRLRSSLSHSQSAHALPPMPEYSGKRDDTEMTDAGSLSGDTIAASSVGHSDDEMSKPPRVDLPIFTRQGGTVFGLVRGSGDRNDG